MPSRPVNKSRYSLEQRIFSAESVLKRPKNLFFEMLRDAKESYSTAVMLAARDIKAEYRQSVLGIFWAFVPPIVLAAGLSYARRSNVLNTGETSIPYAAYVIIGMAFWQTFVASVQAPMRGLRSAKGMLCKVYFPRETIVLSEFLKVCFYFVFQLVLVIGVFIRFQIPLTWTACLALPALLVLILFGMACGMVLAPVGLLFEDVGNALGPFLALWMVLTPVLYPASSVSGFFHGILAWNPVAPMIVSLRELTVGEPLTYAIGFALWVPGSMTVFLLAALYFRASVPFVIERWSA